MTIAVQVRSPTIQIRTAAATTAWSAQQIRDLGGMLGRGLVAKSAEYVVVEADRGKTIVCSGTFDVDLPSAATVGIGWMVAIMASSGTITVDGDGSETIQTPAGTAATATLTAGQSLVLQSNGTNWITCASTGLPSAPTATVTAAAFIGGSFDGTSASGILTRQAATQDAVALVGRAGGTSSYVATITPTTLTASRTWTGPDADIIVSGSASALTSGRIPHATTGGILTDSAGLTYTGGASHQLDVGDGSLGATLRVNGAAGQARDMRYLTNGSNRWLFRVSATAESGSDAGSDFQILPRADAGGAIDTAFQIVRAAGGAITLARPTIITSSLRVSNTAATITSGTGSPEGVVTAPVGSLFLRTDGGAGTTLYIKESGAGNTGWDDK